jgi:hypothetical protein
VQLQTIVQLVVSSPRPAHIKHLSVIMFFVLFFPLPHNWKILMC